MLPVDDQLVYRLFQIVLRAVNVGLHGGQALVAEHSLDFDCVSGRMPEVGGEAAADGVRGWLLWLV